MTFTKFGKLNKHDIGAVFNSQYLGTALQCLSPGHVNISVNTVDFKFASKCFTFVYFQNNLGKVKLHTMIVAIELFKRAEQKENDEYRIIRWSEIEEPNAKYEIPFDE